MAKNALTAVEVQGKKAKAVQFLRDVVGDDDRADEFEDLDLDEYADHKGITIINQGGTKVANGKDPRTKAELLDEVDQLQQENQDLQDQLNAIVDIVSPPDDDDDVDDDGNEDSD